MRQSWPASRIQTYSVIAPDNNSTVVTLENFTLDRQTLVQHRLGEIHGRSTSDSFHLLSTHHAPPSSLSALHLPSLKTPTAKSNDWTEFRGSEGQGHALKIQPALKWTETENVTWKVEVPGVGWSSPVVANGNIYITTAVSNSLSKAEDSKSSLSLRTIKLKAESGEVIWDNEVFQIADSSSLQFHKKKQLCQSNSNFSRRADLRSLWALRNCLPE